MRSLSQALNALILVVEDTLTKPARYQTIVQDSGFSELAAEIRRHDAKPAEHIRCTYSAIAIVYLLEAFYAGGGEPTSPWLSAVGAALPLLRGEAWQAFRNEKAQAAPEEYRR